MQSRQAQTEWRIIWSLIALLLFGFARLELWVVWTWLFELAALGVMLALIWRRPAKPAREAWYEEALAAAKMREALNRAKTPESRPITIDNLPSVPALTNPPSEPARPEPGGLNADQVNTARHVGHDLNNALTTVVSCAGELQLFLSNKDDLREVIADLDEASTRSVRLARELQSVLRQGEARPLRTIETQTGSETVLLVDDELAVRRTMSRVLESAGYTVLQAGSAAEALTVCDAPDHEIRLLLTDVWMPEVDGLVLAREVQHRMPHVRILLMTGHLAETQNLLGRPLNHSTLLAKPFSAERLTRRVREILDGDLPPMPLA